MLDLLAAHGGVRAAPRTVVWPFPDSDTIDTIDDLAYLYLDFLTEQNARDAVVIGSSLGGWIAAEMAVRCADRLGALVLIAPLGIKVGDRETRDIPDIFALPPEEVARLLYQDPARVAGDVTTLSDDQLTIIARNREGRIVKLEGNPDHPVNAGAISMRGSPCPRSCCGRRRSFVSASYYGAAYQRAIRAPGSRRSTGPDASPSPAAAARVVTVGFLATRSSPSAGCRRRNGHARVVLQRARITCCPMPVV